MRLRITTVFVCCLFLCNSLTANADSWVIESGLPDTNIEYVMNEPDTVPEKSLDFEILTEAIDGEEGNSSSSRTGKSFTNKINQQTNKARIKEQDSDPFMKAVNHAELHPHFWFPMYNIKSDNGYGGQPQRFKPTYEYPVTKTDVEEMDKFAEEHFTDDMTNYDKIEYTWDWIWREVEYAFDLDWWYRAGQYGYGYGCFHNKAGQCINYNGALASLMAYMGYDVYMMEMYTSGQHFRMEVDIDGEVWGIEVGNKHNSGDWHWLGVREKANIPNPKDRPDDLYAFRKYDKNIYESWISPDPEASSSNNTG